MEQQRIKTYIINLPKDTDRRISVVKELSKIPCLDLVFVDAVDGKELGKEKLGKLFDFKKSKNYQSNDLALGEVGCTLSHYECYKRLLASDQEFALIVEDDVGFKGNGPFNDFWEKAVEHVKSEEPVILQLFSYFDYMGKGVSCISGHKIYKTYKSALTTIYLINRQAARIMTSDSLPYWIADDWSLFRRKGICTMALYPSFAYHKDETFGSSIGWNDRKKRTIRIPRSWIEFHAFTDECIRFVFKKLGVMKHKDYIRYHE